MKKISYFIIVCFSFFISMVGVSALEKGSIGDYSYEETEKQTNYFKIEFSDNNFVLAQFDTKKYPFLVKKIKEQISDQAFDGASIYRSPINDFRFSSFEFKTFDINGSKNFNIPVNGDLIASVEEDSESIVYSSFDIYLKGDTDVKQPVFGHIITSLDVLDHVTTSNVSTIRFVNVTKLESGKESGSGLDTTNPTSGGGVSTPQAGTSYCSNPEFIKPFKFLGRIFTVVKIIIPLIIIAFGIWDMMRSVISSKEDEIKKSIRSLLFRVAAGVIIFFIPTIINTVFRLVDDWNQYSTDYSNCSKCVSNPSKC